VFAAACATTGHPRHGTALVAVGGYGRGELSPGSDLDIVLLHSGKGDVEALAEKIWYPIWDSGVRLDHSVRTLEQARRLANSDVAVLLGLLDLRHLAGDPGIVSRLRSTVLSDWRAAARKRLPELHEMWDDRAERYGDLRHAIEPDLKEGRGGLRDLVSLRAVAASWVADRPHRDIDDAVRRLGDVRDALHLVTGRAGNRLLLQEQDAVADRLQVADADVLLREVATAASSVTQAAEVTWRRAMQATRGSGASKYVRGRRRPVLRLLGVGLAEHEGEAVLTGQGDPTSDPLLGLRFAARAARAGLPLSPSSVDRLAADSPALPEPWPDAARNLLIDLLGAGPALVPAWEALDEAGLIERMLPEWSLVRHLPQRNAVHVFSVDRHLLETVVEARRSLRDVSRPDLLLLGALLHDIGKGSPGDHSVAGASLAAAVAARIGLAPADVDVVRRLVRHHLLLVETATRRDLGDPATSQVVTDAVETKDVLDILHALTAADARATGPSVWGAWRAGLVEQLVDQVRGSLAGAPEPEPSPLTPHQLDLVKKGVVTVELADAGHGLWSVTLASPDQRGLFATVAGVLALHRLSVRAAQVATVDGMALDVWTVAPEGGGTPELATLRHDVRRALEGELDLRRQLERRDSDKSEARDRKGLAPPEPRVDVMASASATIVEVRAGDTVGLLHRLGRAIALLGLGIRAARVATVGAEVVDVFYLVDAQGGPLDPETCAEVRRVLRDACS
jgi:[protein-PII] uridylyltransferase